MSNIWYEPSSRKVARELIENVWGIPCTHADAESVLGLFSRRSLSCNRFLSSLVPRLGNLRLSSTRLSRFSHAFCDWWAPSCLSISRFKTFFASSSDKRSLDCRQRSLLKEVTQDARVLWTALISQHQKHIYDSFRVSVSLNSKKNLVNRTRRDHE